MKRIEDYEQILDDLHEDLSRQCRDLREKLDAVYDQDPSAALDHTEQLTEVFRKLKTLKNRGEVLRSGLAALREMDRLKEAILERVRELGPQYARYCAARAALKGDGDQELQELFTEADAGFLLNYGEIEGHPIGPFRALEPPAFSESEGMDPEGGGAMPAPVPAAAPDPAPEPAAEPFSTTSSFEEEAGAAIAMPPAPEPAATLEVPEVPEPAPEPEPEPEPPPPPPPEPEPPPPPPPPPEPEPEPPPEPEPEPSPDVAAMAAMMESEPPAPPAEPEVSSDAAALAAMLDDDDDEPDPTEAPVASLLSEPPQTGGPSLDPDPVDAMQDVFGGEAAPAAAPADEAEVGGAAADLLSMMDDDDDEPAAPAPAPAPEPAPAAAEASPGEVAGAATAASLLAELEDDDDDDPFEGLDLDGGGDDEDPLDDF